jgi:hypothetical protein
MKSAAKLLLLLLALLLGAAAGKVAVLAQGQGKAQKDAKPHDTKNRSFFAGAKPVAASGSQQQGLTATGGTKGLDGQMIGSAQPTATDRAMVGAMENYSIPEADLKQFQEDGKLIPAK